MWASLMLGSIRHHLRIHRSAADVWSLVGDPARLHEWFPGIVDCSVDGATRTITLAAGWTMPEDILVHDHVRRRFQYAITAPLFTFHRGSIDVLELDDDTCVVVYTTDCDPRTMALTIGGATAGALERLRELMEIDTAASAPHANGRI